jgi:hypothetical protein
MRRWNDGWNWRGAARSCCALALLAFAARAGGQEVPLAPPVALPPPGEAVAVDSVAAPAEYPQRDLPDVLKERLLHRRIEPQLGGTLPAGISWTMLPTFSYNPAYGFAFGASFSGGGRLGEGPAAKPTAAAVSGNYSTTGQLQAQFKGDIFTASGNYLIKADIRYLDTARSTWGLGPAEAGQQEYPMEFKLVRWYGTLYRRTSGPVYLGLGYHFDDNMDILDERAAKGESTPFTEYAGSPVTRSRASGLSFNLLGDTRDDIINPSKGYYLSGVFRDYLTSLGSDRNWQEFWTEVRLYPHLPAGSKNVLAFWVYSWMAFGPAPYLGLPAIGWDTYGRGGRGYLQGRIRGQDQVYAECEYRAQLTRDGLLGAVFFINMTATTSPERQIFGRIDNGGGVGLRMKLNKRSRTNLTIDHGWGENGSGGWFLGTTETF